MNEYSKPETTSDDDWGTSRWGTTYPHIPFLPGGPWETLRNRDTHASEPRDITCPVDRASVVNFEGITSPEQQAMRLVAAYHHSLEGTSVRVKTNRYEHENSSAEAAAAHTYSWPEAQAETAKHRFFLASRAADGTTSAEVAMMDFTPDGVQADQVILVAPSGQRYKITVSDSGQLTTEAI